MSIDINNLINKYRLVLRYLNDGEKFTHIYELKDKMHLEKYFLSETSKNKDEIKTYPIVIEYAVKNKWDKNNLNVSPNNLTHKEYLERLKSTSEEIKQMLNYFSFEFEGNDIVCGILHNKDFLFIDLEDDGFFILKPRNRGLKFISRITEVGILQ
ncbi:MAG: hypothetical protein KC550_04500 [Nanoarchaeota archaeon]|nr:hypothetical protein [Nanoarchaeota archaeon]